ncbi:MAG: transcriptional regulator [Peptococcaceae bacterium]|jgi:CarD family transcriptional regulator|nr:transcriptional regulator [Peptococcaceae bacterium]
MFKLNDYVVYNSTGVYKIVDIRKEKDINDEYVDYYILEPVYGHNLTVKIPITNRKVSMRKIMSKDEVLALISAMPDIEPVWINDDRKRYESFKSALKTAECLEWVKIVKTMYLKKQERMSDGKKLAKADEDIMKAAEKNMNEEFAAALNISPDEVIPYIRKRIPS